jgi:hypothetical protein
MIRYAAERLCWEAILAGERGVPEEAIRLALNALPDVQSSKVEFDKGGSISAVHVVSCSKRPAKQIVRDIESVVKAHFGIEIDHRKISVARLTEKGESKPTRLPRPRLISVSLTVRGGTGKCEVVLERNGFETAGEATGVTAGGGSLRLVANATFRAVERLVGQEVVFDLVDVIRLKAGQRETFVVLASYVSANDVRNLTGCVQHGENEQQAVVYAALDACNRIVEILPPPEQTEYEIGPFEES